MAVAGATTTTPPHYNTRITCLLVLSCLMAATGGLLFGYDTGVTGGVTSMDAFLKKFFPGVYRQMQEETPTTSNYCKFDSLLLTSFTASIYASGLIATVLASHVTPRYGRKASIMVGGIAFVAGATLGGAAPNIYMLISGRVLLGIGIGFANQSVPLYLSEMAPPKYRGAFNYSFQFFVAIGTAAALLINYAVSKITGGWGWRISLAAAALPALILTIGAIFLPETPASFIQRGHNVDRAKRLLQRIRGVDDVEEELDDLITASCNSAAIKQPLKTMLRREYRPQLVMSIAIPFFQQMTGIQVITFYAPILFRTIGFGEGASLMSTVVLGLVGTCTTVFSGLIVDKLGRRVLFQIGGIQMLVTQIAIGGIMMVKLGDHGTLSQGYGNLLVVMICIYVAGFGLSWGPLGWLVSSEVYPLEVRSTAQSITVGVCFFTSFLVGQTFLGMLCRMKAGTFFFYGAWVALMTVFVHLLLPETKNVPTEKMDLVWRKHDFWKRYVCVGTIEDTIEEPFLR